MASRVRSGGDDDVRRFVRRARRRHSAPGRRRHPVSLAAAAATAVALLGACAEEPRGDASLSLVETLGGADTAGYARAIEPRAFVFPKDHGPHTDFRTEWWYVTGNLEGAEGRAVGFQLTFFRSSLAPAPPDLPSTWATNQAWMAHLAVTDVEGGRFHAFERFARGGAGLAGAVAEPFRVWLEDWSLEGEGGDAFPMTLRASEEEVGLALRLEAGKPRVLQGEAGLSRKGPEPGNASYYYSRTRMPAVGRVRLGADSLAVTGEAWLDREWSTSVLSDGQVGWDWFALQLDDGRDLMVYQLRGADGSAHPMSEGVLVGSDGSPRRLRWGEDVRVEATDTWRSPLDGTEYPSAWVVHLPAEGLRLGVEPVLEDQELRLAFRYWEGAVRVRPESPGSPGGRGYVELAGYAHAPDELRR